MKKGMAAVLGTIAGSAIGAAAVGRISHTAMEDKDKRIYKFKSYYNLLNQWLCIKQENKSLEKYFMDNSYKTIAIYGMGEMGNRLYEDLKQTNIEVKYAIDKDGGFGEIDIFDMEDEFPEVDAIVVTAIFDFETIEENLREKVNYDIVSLEDVVYEI